MTKDRTVRDEEDRTTCCGDNCCGEYCCCKRRVLMSFEIKRRKQTCDAPMISVAVSEIARGPRSAAIHWETSAVPLVASMRNSFDDDV